MRSPEKAPPISGARKIGSEEKANIVASIISWNATMKRPQTRPTRIEAGT